MNLFNIMNKNYSSIKPTIKLFGKALGIAIFLLNNKLVIADNLPIPPSNSENMVQKIEQCNEMGHRLSDLLNGDRYYINSFMFDREVEDMHQCYTEAISLASNTSEPSICDKIKDDLHGYNKQGNQFRKKCLTEIAKIKMDDSICDRAENAPSECLNPKNSIAADECDSLYNRLAEENRDASLCNSIINSDKKNECLSDLMDMKRVYMRSNIEYVDCHYEFGTAVGQNKGIEWCALIKNETAKAICIYEVAELKNDSEICALLDLEEDKEECQSIIAKKIQDAYLCENIKDKDRKDECFTEIAIEKKDINLCKNINEEDRKDECFTEIAVEKEDIHICDNISIRIVFDDLGFAICDALREEIEEEEGKTIDPLECRIQSYYNDYSQRYSCYNGVAIAKNDINLCLAIPNLGWHGEREKKYCQMGIFRKMAISKDASICKNIEQLLFAQNPDDNEFNAEEKQKFNDALIKEKSICIHEVATEKQDPFICQTIPYNFDRDNCLLEFLSKRDEKICNEVSDSYDNKSYCYETIAILKKDISICRNIKQYEREKACMDRLSFHNSKRN